MYPSQKPIAHFSFSTILLLTACFMLTASFFLPAAVNAQTEVTGAIEGRVTNSQKPDEPVAGATVQIINLESQVQTATKTDTDGRFVKNQLPPGRYKVVVKANNFQTKEIDRVQPIDVELTNKAVPIPISLDPSSLATATPSPSPTEPSQPGVTPTPSPSASPSTTGGTVATRGKTVEEDSDIRNEINTTDGRRGGGYREKEVSTLPLGGTTLVRSFDELALLLPGVAAPPQTQGSVAGPGVGAGVGSAGQFSVNGLRSRSNNFTIDGSDNNDTDIGVRRQGFLALVPQPIESIEAFRVITLLAPAQYGRNFGAQVNAISKSGTSQTHGTVFGFFNSSQLNSRNFFDTEGANTFAPLQANGQNVILRTRNAAGIQVAPDQTIPISFQSGGKESLTLGQAGFVLGGPLVMPDPNNARDRSLFYFFSVEGQLLNATKEASFAVPTIAQRGLFNSGVTGVFADPFFPVGNPNRNVIGSTEGRRGAGIFSLFPFPNNPTGIYGANTLTRTLPASGFGKVLSGKVNGNFYVNGKRQDITARYNFTDDARTIPVTGGALFSSVRPRVRTQNFSTFLNSEVTNRITNEVRASYGRTRLVFDDVPDREFLIPSQALPGQPFLLNAPYMADITRPNAAGVANTGPVIFFRNSGDDPFRRTSEDAAGPLGQVRIAGFSPLGVDVFNFPQSRVNNTYQLADTLNISHGKHRFAFGEDIRRVELNSDLPRNSRPLVVYGGQVGSDQRIGVTIGGTNVVVTPQDFVAAGAPTGFLQTLNTTGTSAIGLRDYEYDFFGQDEWRIHPNLSISYGLRYEYNTPPREMNNRIESTFNSSLVNSLLPALRSYLDGRTEIYDTSHTNFAPRIGIAYSRRLFGSDRETVFRAGYGIYYDTILGAVVSQSRNAFPTFLTLNFGGGTSQFNTSGALDLFSPATVGFCRDVNCTVFDPFRQPGTLNRLNPNVSLQELFGSVSTFLSAGGFGVTLPTRRLKSPMAQHYAFTVEQPLGRNTVVSIAYVGTQGRHLLRINTPNAGENVGIAVDDFDVGATTGFPQIFGFVLPPTIPSPTATSRPSGPNSALGAVNLIQTTANSRYDALQVQVRGRFVQHFQYQASYTFSKATDDASDFFDLAGAPALPQDFTNLAAERGPSNFDVRHRFSYNLIYTLPAFNNHSHAFRSIFGGLEIASIGQFQTGQPFTVNSIFDVNGDGNFTDRLNSLNGLVVTGDRRQPLRLTTSNTTSLLAADFTDGSIGRNTFRAGSIWTTDLAVAKIVSLSERVKMTFRMEIFNVFNRANFGIPVRFLESPAFGQATDTVTPGRRIQFALKLNF
jgi:hypothetical protein